MKKANGFHRYSVLGALLASCLLPGLSFGTVTANPAKVTFTSPQQSAAIKLANDGVPIPAKDIRGWQFLASSHDYKYMLTVEKADGVLTIAPSKALEVGSYDLNIDTAQGSVIVRVFTPLTDEPQLVEKMAALTGSSEKKIAAKFGSIPTGREDVKIDLPPVYYEGQTLEMTMEQPSPGRTCMWFMNGDQVTNGPQQNTISYTFKDSGEYVLTYIETEKKNDVVGTVAHARASTRVVPVPGVAIGVAINVETEFAPPSGYQKYAWKIDGTAVSSEPTLKHAFADSGVHTVECFASSPTQGPEQGFLRLRYNTTVNAK